MKLAHALPVLLFVYFTCASAFPFRFRNARVVPEPQLIRSRGSLIRLFTLTEFMRQVRRQYGYPSARVQLLAANPLSREQLIERIINPSEEPPFVQVGDYRSSHMLELAMPVLMQRDAASGIPFAFLSLRLDTFRRPVIVVRGYARLHYADGVLDLLHSDATAHLDQFSPGRVLSRTQVFELLHAF